MKLRAIGKWFAALAAGVLFAAAAHAKIVGKTVEYKYQDMTMKGYLAYDDAARGARPGVLVVHEWWGLNDYIRERTKQVAALGYVAFAPDMYGEGKTTDDPKVAGQWSGEVVKSGERAPRAKAGLEVLLKQPHVKKDDIGAMGFCFGGGMVWRLLAAGEARVAAAAPFYGPFPENGDLGRAKAAVLGIYGGLDARVGATRPAAQAALAKAGLKHHLVVFEQADHAFFNDTGARFDPPAAAEANRRVLEWFDRYAG